MLIRDDITFKHGKCLKNERIIALYSLLLISLQKQQNQIISTDESPNDFYQNH